MSMASEFPGEKSRVRSVVSGCPASCIATLEVLAKIIKKNICTVPLKIRYTMTWLPHLYSIIFQIRKRNVLTDQS